MLIDIVREDVRLFMQANEELMFNERDFQMRLSLSLLNSGHYDDVDLEYHLPVGLNEDFDAEYARWETEKPSIDVVVRKGDEYVPIELKYKLKAVKAEISRFGEKSKSEIEIIPNQFAQNLARYAFWKDVKRVELVKKYYRNVNSGLSVFLTNDPSYLTAKRSADYYSFSMEEGHTAIGTLDWATPKPKFPPINLDGQYNIEWAKTSFNQYMDTAYYTIVTI